MAKRPVLKVGDVVRLSKKGLRIYQRQRARFDTMVVHTVGGDGSDGRSRITCTYFEAGKAHRARFKRRDLWATGYNAMGSSQVAAPKMNVNLYAPPSNTRGNIRPTSVPTKTNDGRTHCVSCSLPTTFIPGFGSGGYNICKNKSCKMYDT